MVAAGHLVLFDRFLAATAYMFGRVSRMTIDTQMLSQMMSHTHQKCIGRWECGCVCGGVFTFHWMCFEFETLAATNSQQQKRKGVKAMHSAMPELRVWVFRPDLRCVEHRCFESESTLQLDSKVWNEECGTSNVPKTKVGPCVLLATTTTISKHPGA